MPHAPIAALRRLIGPALIGTLLATTPAPAFDKLDFTVKNAEPALQTALRNASLLTTAQRDGKTDPQDLFAAAQADYAQLLGTLYAAGHYSATIHILIDGQEAAAIAPLDAPPRIGTISVTIDAGPVFRFSRLALAPLAPGTALPAGFATGQPARSGTLRDAATAGIDGWRAVGHAKASIATQDITADHRTARLAADITLAPGPELRFGPLVIKGQDRMRPDRIRAIAGLPTGETFSPETLDLAATRLRRSGVFRSVTLQESETITAPNLLAVTATVVEEKPRRYSLGAEVASFDGVTLSGYWLHRNLLGGAERLRVSAEVANLGAQSSGTDYSLGVTLDRPATFSPDTTLGLAAEIARKDEADYTADTLSFGLTATHTVSQRLTLSGGLFYDYAKGRDGVSDFEFRNVSLPLGTTWDRRDDSANPTRGTYLVAEAKPFLGLGTTDSGLRLSWDARAYRGLGSGRLVFAARFQGGVIFGADLLQTPRDDLFYSGGGGSVRGQPYQSLGVNLLRINGSSARIGGNHYLGSQLEARLRLTAKLGLVGFYDIGQIGAGSFFGTDSHAHSGAGLGLRYDTGFGPVRLDVAAPTSGTSADGVQIYVGLGQAF